MVSEGITKARLPANNQIICTLNEKSVPEIAKRISNTRTAAAIHLWEDYIQDSLIVFGNAPTALFYLLEFLNKKKDLKPAGIIGCPVGFVGAAESKQALTEVKTLNSLVVKGRLGGSAVAVAAVNALAQEKE
jgi:precorrin-8X/cobalt-precorrin-8 methylmutase